MKKTNKNRGGLAPMAGRRAQGQGRPSRRMAVETPGRMAGEDRKQSIARAALPLFARQGFRGTTTKDIARAAGVSEALIFRHFPSKESLYAQSQFLCMEATGAADAWIAQAPDDTRTLVLAVVILVYEVYTGFGGREKNELLRRLQTHSLLEDGRFARAFFDENFTGYFPKVIRCLRAARRNGDLRKNGVSEVAAIWFVHHLAMMVRLSRLPAEAAIDYHCDDRALMDQMVRFSLSGLGLTEQAIRRCYQPALLRQLAEAKNRL